MKWIEGIAVTVPKAKASGHSRRVALFIGRFQPFHLGHLHVIVGLSKEFDDVIVGVGSAQHSHTKDNPFSAGERHLMISGSLDEAGITNYHIVPIPDVNRNSVWVAHVKSYVPPFDVVFTNNPLAKRLFSEAGHEVRPAPFYKRETYSATVVRDMIRDGKAWSDHVPAAVERVILAIDGPKRIRESGRSDAPSSEVEGPFSDEHDA